jgi:predicted MPP superfamily phosphohydrolase
MLGFLFVAILIYGSMNIYALSKVWMAFPHSFGMGLSLALWGLVMTFSPLIIWQMARQNLHSETLVASWVAYVWMGFLFLFCCLALVIDLCHFIATLLGIGWSMNVSVEFRVVSSLALAMVSYGFIEARQLQVEKITITTPKLVSERITIAQISDLHLGMMRGEEFLERIMSRLREIQPDIIVATGDILDGQGDDLNELSKLFLTYNPPKGAYAILGNHEVYAGLEKSLRFLNSAGFTVLRGQSVASGGIVLVGIDDPSAGRNDQETKTIDGNAFSPFAQGKYIVLLKHQPVIDNNAIFDLQLSGHVHGGQIFPFGLLTRLSYGVVPGLTSLSDDRFLYVSRGAGTWGPPIRLFAPPEITLITIQSENK